MEKAFLNFCKEINWDIPTYLEETIITSVILQENNTFLISVVFKCFPDVADLKTFIKTAQKNFSSVVVFNFVFEKNNLNKELIYKYISFFSQYYLKLEFESVILFSNINFLLDEKKIIFKCFEKKTIFFWEKNKEKIEGVLNKISLGDFSLEIINFSEQINKEEEIEVEKRNNIKEFLTKNNNTPKNVQISKNDEKMKYGASQIISASISDIYERFDQSNLIEGEIISKNIFETKTGTTVFDFLVTDFKEAIHCKFFSNTNEKKQFIEEITVGNLCKIIGKKNTDTRGVPFIVIRKIEILNETDFLEKIEDLEEKKRVEICIRTHMTSMDGFKSPTDFIEHAKLLNHDTIAIIDKNSVQAFPEFYLKTKKEKIKPIYGVTLTVIEKGNGIINNKKTGSIFNEKYVVFDLETTGLSPICDEIIQIGACLIEEGRITKRLNYFIKIEKKLKEITKELTGITESDLETGITEKEAIINFLNFCKDYTVVAHNAKFDIGFITEKMSLYNCGEFKNQFIDTLALSYFVISSSSYRLEKIAKKTGVNYDPLVAHKADYDADVLAKVFIKFLSFLKIKKIETFDEINELQEKIFFTKKRGSEVSFYAKNQNGLKKIFKLVSKAHVESIFGEPKLFIEDIEKDNDLLIGYTGINSKIVENIFTGTTKNIEWDIDFCDFVSIPYLSLFKHRFIKEDLSKEQFSELVKKIIYKTKEKKKLVIGSGDVRYNKEYESSFHEVYINAKSLQGRRHYLYNDKEKNPQYPKQLFLNTKQTLEEYNFLNSKELAYEIVVENSQKFANLISNDIVVIKDELYSPDFDNSKEKLPALVYENAYKKYGKPLNKFIEDRIKRELEPIIKYGFSDVYWISYKLVKKSLDDGYLVGSRGSVGSSIVATLLNITEVNPLPPHYFCKKCKETIFVDWKKENVGSGYDLENMKCEKCGLFYEKDGQNIPFETFLGFNADKVPDIDLNFSGVYQPIIHQEVQNLFGEKNCFRAGTISTIAPKTAFALVKEWNNNKDNQKSIAYVDMVANKIAGSKRTTGQHPGGIIIVPKNFDIEEFTPINYPSNDESKKWKTTHFDFHSIHDNLLKLDLLGHDDPTAIKLLEELTKTNAKEIPFNDPKVLSLFTSNKILELKHTKFYPEKTGAMGIPEFGTSFVRKMLSVAKPESFADLISVSGLSHGTGVWQGNAEYLISEKKLTIKDVISCRDDIMTFLISCGVEPIKSFQIMEKVRKGIRLSEDEEKILVLNNVPKWYIDSLARIQYLFPKAHATAYVMMAWRIAWYKLYYPLEYYAAYFSTRADFFDIKTMIGSEQDVFSKLNEIKNGIKNGTITAKEEKLIPILEIVLEMLARGITFENMSLEKSDSFNWKINKETKTIIPPFISVDGLGEAAAKSIIKAREEKEFNSVQDLSKRTLLNKTSIEKLKELGLLKKLSDTNQTTLF